MTNLIISVEKGKIKGKCDTDYLGGSFYSFLGIPYAKSPIGELRFKPAQEAEAWSEVLDCTQEGNECPSQHMFFEYLVGSEEKCLNLNVHMKKMPENNTELKPVMVWIHGGGFLYGSNRKELFGPDYLMTQDIILVLINYRLGVLGFLSLEDNSLQVPGNNGLKDMIFALKWVKRNIKQFGGDPDNITIFGESAGSAAVHYLVMSPLSQGLFNKAIAQSGCSINTWSRGRHNAKDIAKYIGYKETDEKQIFEKLKKEPWKNIVNAQFKHKDFLNPREYRPFGPVIEPSSPKAFISEDPKDIIKNGTFNKVPMIMGYNSKEGMFYEILRRTRHAKIPKSLKLDVPFDVLAEEEEGSEKLNEIIMKIKKFYFNGNDCTESNIDRLYELKGDNNFVYGITKAVLGQKRQNPQPLYFYRMSLDSPLNIYKRVCGVKHLKTLFLFYFLMKQTDGMAKNFFSNVGIKIPDKPMDGVCHADDLGYFFTLFFTPKIVENSTEDMYIKRFLKMWTNFAKFGNPTPDAKDELLNNVVWNPLDLKDVKMLKIDKTLEMISNPDQERMDFWDNIYEGKL